MKRTLTIVGLIVLVLSASAALAQPDMPRHGKGRHGNMDWGANIENLRFLKMLEVLAMDDDQSAGFVPVFHQFRQDIRALRVERKEILDTLASFLNKENSSEDIMKIVQDLQVNLDKMQARTDQFFRQCADILTPYQLGRLVMFHERFEKEVLESIREFRQKGMNAPDPERKGR